MSPYKEWSPIRKYYALKEVSAITGVEEPVLYKWCSYFKLGNKAREANTRWRLTEEDIARIYEIKYLSEKCGYTHRGIREVLRRIDSFNTHNLIKEVLSQIAPDHYVQENLRMYKLFSINLLNHITIDKDGKPKLGK